MAIKKVVYTSSILLVVVAVSMMVEAVEQKIIIDIPGSFVMNGKNISVLGQGKGMISVDIDGVIENVEEDTINNISKFVNGVYIQIIALSKSPARAVLNVTVNVNCGNGVCEVGESYSICCADCGCNSASRVCSNNRCLENITSISARNQCYVDSDCDDKSACTTERCDTSQFPNKCVRTDIVACIAGDQCCPKHCDTDQDIDCAHVNKCETNADCVDSEACTQETCVGAPKRCQYASQDGCTYKGACIVQGTVREGSYCRGKSHEWLSQKIDGQQCAEDFECIAGICDGGVCGQSKSKTLTYAFYTIGLMTIIMTMWYISLTRKTKPSQQS